MKNIFALVILSAVFITLSLAHGSSQNLMPGKGEYSQILSVDEVTALNKFIKIHPDFRIALTKDNRDKQFLSFDKGYKPYLFKAELNGDDFPDLVVCFINRNYKGSKKSKHLKGPFVIVVFNGSASGYLDGIIVERDFPLYEGGVSPGEYEGTPVINIRYKFESGMPIVYRWEIDQYTRIILEDP